MVSPKNILHKTALKPFKESSTFGALHDLTQAKFIFASAKLYGTRWTTGQLERAETGIFNRHVVKTLNIKTFALTDTVTLSLNLFFSTIIIKLACSI